MADTSKTGTDWQDEELDAIVAAYFDMLALDAAGQPFVKAHRARLSSLSSANYVDKLADAEQPISLPGSECVV